MEKRKCASEKTYDLINNSICHWDYAAADKAKALSRKDKAFRNGVFYLIVGRFVPENNYETMIKEYMKSKTKKDFAIITNANPQLQKELEEKLGYQKDPRIKFVGTVYD